MKIGIISTVGGYSWAGSEEMWKLLALEALREGHEVAVCALAPIARSEELGEFRSLGGRTFAYRQLNGLTRRLVNCRCYGRFTGIGRWRPDVVCVSGSPVDCFWQPDLLRFLNSGNFAKVFILQSNVEAMVAGDNQRKVLRALYPTAARLIFASRQNAVMLERQLAVALPNVVVLPSPIRLRLEQPLEWPDAADGEVRFATVARYDAGCKCQDQTLEALASREWKDRNWSLSLFGSGPDEAYLHDLIRYFKLGDKVTVRGFVRDFREIWNTHHLHILNSRAEGLTLALIESMFCGRPALVTRAGGNAELVRDGIDGFVSPGMHPEIIRETLERAWTARNRWQDVGKAAFERAAEWVPEDLGPRLLKAVTTANSSEEKA